MPWIKRNLILVVSGVVALVLIVGAAMFLVSNIQKNATALEDLERQTRDLRTLATRVPFPSDENIQATRDDAKKMEEVLEQAREILPLIEIVQISDREFKAKLEDTIAVLQRRATNSGVRLPPDQAFGFSFTIQRKLFQYATNSVPRLAVQLDDVAAICDVLIQARVNGIESIRRVPVSRDDLGGDAGGGGMMGSAMPVMTMMGPTDDYHHFSPKTNGLVVSTPYEISFLGFTDEVAAVMDGFLHSPGFFVVKSVSVEPSDVQFDMESPDMMMPQRERRPMPAPTRRQPGRGMADPYGGGGEGFRGPGAGTGLPPVGGAGLQRPGMDRMQPQPPQRTYRPPAGPLPQGQRSTTPETVLNEMPLRVTLLIDSIRRLPEDYVPDPMMDPMMMDPMMMDPMMDPMMMDPRYSDPAMGYPEY